MNAEYYDRHPIIFRFRNMDGIVIDRENVRLLSIYKLRLICLAKSIICDNREREREGLVLIPIVIVVFTIITHFWQSF